MDDAEMAVRAAAGRPDAFEALVDRYGGRVMTTALRIAGGDRALAEDMTQEVFLHLLRVLPRYDPARPFAPWILEVAGNLCRNRARGVRRRPAASLEALVEASGRDVASGDSGPADRAEATDEIARLRAARDALPASYREVLALHYEGGLSCEEISRSLGGIPIGTVKNRLHRARAALAARLGSRGRGGR
jgi:RNA polymerase sigma-70 factor (ECF subfamily)